MCLSCTESFGNVRYDTYFFEWKNYYYFEHLELNRRIEDK